MERYIWLWSAWERQTEEDYWLEIGLSVSVSFYLRWRVCVCFCFLFQSVDQVLQTKFKSPINLFYFWNIFSWKMFALRHVTTPRWHTILRLTFPTQTTRTLHNFWDNLLYSIILWLMISSLRRQNQHLLYYFLPLGLLVPYYSCSFYCCCCCGCSWWWWGWWLFFFLSFSFCTFCSQLITWDVV